MRNDRIDLNDVMAKIRAGDGNTWLTRGEASALIASRTLIPHDCEDVARNRVGMQLDRAQLPGGDFEIFELQGFGHGRFTVDTIHRWAEKKFDVEWARKRAEKYGEQYGEPIDVSDLPYVTRSWHNAIVVGANSRVATYPLRIPGDIQECQIGFAQMARALEKLGYHSFP